MASCIQVVKSFARPENSSKRGYNERTASDIYIVRWDSPVGTIPNETASHGGVTIPAFSTPHPDDGSRTVQFATVHPLDDTGCQYLVQVDYSTNVSGATSGPLGLPDEISWDFSNSSQKYFIDTAGDPVINSAGEPFEDFLEREHGSIRATVKRNVAYSGGFSPAVAVNVKDCVNSDGFTIDGEGISAGQAKMTSYSAGPRQVSNGVTYRELSFIIDFREHWTDIVEDRGLHEIDPDHTGKIKEIIKGTPPIKPDRPWPLDGSGAAKPNVDDEPETITFEPYNTVAFSGFGFH